MYVMEFEAPPRIRRAVNKTATVPGYVSSVIEEVIEKRRNALAMERLEREKRIAEQKGAHRAEIAEAQVKELQAALEAASKASPPPTPSLPQTIAPTGLLGALAGVFTNHVSAHLQGAVLAALYTPEARKLLSTIVKDAITEIASKMTPPAPETPAAPANDFITVTAHMPRQRKPKVVVVGLLGEQAGAVSKEMGGEYQLVFLASDVTSKRLKMNLTGADKAYGMVRFMDHRADGIIAKTNIPYTRVNGGVTDLIRLLKADGPSYRAVSGGLQPGSVVAA